MATGTKRCKVCGKEYPYCKTASRPGVFRYQDVACCPEHGSIYLKRVMDARSNKIIEKDESDKAENNTEEELKYLTIEDDIEDDNNDEDDDFDIDD